MIYEANEIPKQTATASAGTTDRGAWLREMTLIEALQTIQYDSSWGIWAELSEADENGDGGGVFESSRARFGQKCFENGGLLDGWVFICNGEWPADRLVEWCDGSDECEWDWQFTDQLLQDINEGLDLVD